MKNSGSALIGTAGFLVGVALLLVLIGAPTGNFALAQFGGILMGAGVLLGIVGYAIKTR
jgi:hypothetical protein